MKLAVIIAGPDTSGPDVWVSGATLVIVSVAGAGTAAALPGRARTRVGLAADGG
jgi:hypothetical protein